MEGMLKPGSLQGKTIIITGGGTGLGRSMGKYMLELGANLVITSRKKDVLEKAASELEKETGGKVLPVVCDVRKYEEIDALIKQTETTFGQIHGVLNNAAGNFISPTERLSHRAFDIVVDIVLKGTYYTTLAAGKNWIAKKQGGIFLNIVTTYAWTGSGYVVRAWSRLLPGDLVKKFDPAQRVPLKRVGEHQELANLAAYLLSDYSAYVNGEVITIDGGEWLRSGGEFSHLEDIPESMWDMIEKNRK
ncbi:MAG: SDR family oxidoreductase [Cytophagia bacterium]|nr:SDR family oxidoreductase [Cytophagia bacterium]